MSFPNVLIVTGPTASGKSALALLLAEALGGTIINADAMQLYREFRVLTARPTPEDEARVPHRLYGVRSAAEPASVAWWREAALGTIAEAAANGRLPILCGGSGLYLTSLVEGISPIPEPDAAARAEARALCADEGPAALHARLAARDPETAAKLRPGDSQRITRAWEVLRSSGRGLAHWQAERGAAPDIRFSAILVLPERSELRGAIARRFRAMLEAGALDEVRALGSPDPALPAIRAHGVREIAAYLAGQITLAEAEARSVAATSHYAKRQMTWLRHHRLAPPERTRTIIARIPGSAEFMGNLLPTLVAFVREAG